MSSHPLTFCEAWGFSGVKQKHYYIDEPSEEFLKEVADIMERLIEGPGGEWERGTGYYSARVHAEYDSLRAKAEKITKKFKKEQKQLTK